MKAATRIMLTALAAGVLGGCATSTQPPLSAFQRNIGPGSSVTGVPDDNKGFANGGNTRVPGVSSAGNIGNR